MTGRGREEMKAFVVYASFQYGDVASCCLSSLYRVFITSISLPSENKALILFYCIAIIFKYFCRQCTLCIGPWMVNRCQRC